MRLVIGGDMTKAEYDSDDDGWVNGLLPQTGTGNPNGSVTPRFAGDRYIDTSPTPDVTYEAASTSDTDWRVVTT